MTPALQTLQAITTPWIDGRAQDEVYRERGRRDRAAGLWRPPVDRHGVPSFAYCEGHRAGTMVRMRCGEEAA